MGSLRRREFRRIKKLGPGAQGINYSDQFIDHRYHGLSVTSKLGIFPLEVDLKRSFPLNNSYGHLEKDVSEIGITLFGDTHLDLPFSRLFYDRIGSGIFDQFFGTAETLDIFYFGQEFSRQLGRNAFDRGNTFQLSFHSVFNLIFQVIFQFFNYRFQKEEFFHVELKGLFQAFMRDTHGVLGQLHQVSGGEGRFTARQSGEDVVYFSPSSLGNSFSGGIATKDFKKGLREDIEVFFGFGKKGCQRVFDLGFGFGEFLFEFLDLSGQEFGFGGEGSGLKEMGIGEGKEGQEEGVFLIGLRGVVSGDETDKVMDHLRVEERYLEALIQEEGEKWQVKTSGGLKDDMVWGIGGESFEKVFEPFGRHGKVFRGELPLFWVKDTELEGIFGDIDTYVEHRLPPGIRYMSLSSILPFGRGFCAQPTHWELRDRGTDSFRGSLAYEKWSPCPSINFIPGMDIT